VEGKSRDLAWSNMRRDASGDLRDTAQLKRLFSVVAGVGSLDRQCRSKRHRAALVRVELGDDRGVVEDSEPLVAGKHMA
jgi:hypothetical protein